MQKRKVTIQPSPLVASQSRDTESVDGKTTTLEVRKKDPYWYQFSLRSLVIAIISTSIVGGIFMINDDTAKQEEFIVDEISAFGAEVFFDYEYRNGRFSHNPQPPGWKWLRKQLGDNYFARISYVQLPNGCSQDAFENVTKLKALESIDIFKADQIENLDSVRDLWKLERLSLGDCGSLSDLSPIEPLERLKSLQLPGCHSITDLNVLASKKLKILDVTGSSIANVNFLKGMETLEELYLENSKQLTDVRLIGDLKRLSKLDLRGCDQITAEMIEDLKAQLPTTNLVSDF